MTKKKVKNKIPSKRYKLYKVAGNILERKKFCQRCGPGYFMAQHKNRLYCGNCHYTEFIVGQQR